MWQAKTQVFVIIAVAVITSTVRCAELGGSVFDEAAFALQDAYDKIVLPGKLHHEARYFMADDTGSATGSGGLCTTDTVATRLASLAKQCPIITAYANKSIKTAAFYASFCANGCDTATEVALSPFVACDNAAGWSLDSSVWTTLDYIKECRVRRQCYTNFTLRAAADSVFAECLTPYVFSNFSAAGIAAAKAVCSNASGCRARLANLSAEVSACVSPAIAMAPYQLVDAFDAICSQPADSSVPCYEAMRAVGRISCNGTPKSQCPLPGTWCTWEVDTRESYVDGGRCVNLPMNRTMAAYLCTSCIDLIAARANYLGNTAMDILYVRHHWCMLAAPEQPTTSEYCVNLLKNFSSLPTTEAGLAQWCGDGYGRCLPNYYAWNSAFSTEFAITTLAKCLAGPSGMPSRCANDAARTLRDAEIFGALASTACARNANGTLCYPTAWQLRVEPCMFTGSQGLCPVGCQDFAYSMVNASGCCLPTINRFLRTQSTSFVADYLPLGTFIVQGYNGTVTYNFSSQFSAVLDRSLQPLNALAACSNTSSYWAAVENRCPSSANAVSRSLPMGLAWSALAADQVKYNKILAAVRSDIAYALGLSSDLIRGDSIVENAAVTVTLGSNTRRAAVSSSGSTYRFSIDAGAATSASSIAAAFDAALSSQTFRAISTAQAVMQSCRSCVDASVSLDSPDAFLTSFTNLIGTAVQTSAPTSTTKGALTTQRVGAAPPQNTNASTNATGPTAAPTPPLVTQKSGGFTAPSPSPFPPTDSPVSSATRPALLQSARVYSHVVLLSLFPLASLLFLV